MTRLNGNSEEVSIIIIDSPFPIHGDIQDHAGQGSEQPDLVEDVPAYHRGVGLVDL